MLYITGKEVKEITHDFYGTRKFFESSQNNVYSLTLVGLYYLNGDLATKISASSFSNISEKDDSTVIVYYDDIPVSGSEYYILDGENISNRMLII